MHDFVKFIHKVSQLMEKINPYKKNLSLNHELMCSELIKANPIDHEFVGTYENIERIKHRLHSRRIS